MTPKRPNILRRALSALAVISGREQVTANLILKRSEEYPLPSDLPKKKSASNGDFINNGVSKVQSVGSGWQQRFYRTKIRNYKACGLRRCDSEGNFINRKTGERLAA